MAKMRTQIVVVSQPGTTLENSTFGLDLYLIALNEERVVEEKPIVFEKMACCCSSVAIYSKFFPFICYLLIDGNKLRLINMEDGNKHADSLILAKR